MGGRSGGGSRSGRSRAGGGGINADGTISQRFENSAAFQDQTALLAAARQADVQRRQNLQVQSELRQELNNLTRATEMVRGQRIAVGESPSNLRRRAALERQLVQIDRTINNLSLTSSALWRNIDQIDLARRQAGLPLLNLRP